MSTDTDLWKRIVRQGKVGAVSSIDLTHAEKRGTSLMKQEMWLLLGLVLSLVVWGALHLLGIYLMYKDMIRFIDRGRSLADGSGQYYTASSGFTVAFYYMYPHLDMFSPFRNEAWPQAMFFAYYGNKDWHKYMVTDPRNIQRLYEEVDLGTPKSEVNPLTAICRWLDKIGHGQEGACKVSCDEGYVTSVSEMIGGALSGGMMGGFLGHGMKFGGMGTGGAVILGSLATMGFSLWKSFDNYNRCKEQGGCFGGCKVVRVG